MKNKILIIVQLIFIISLPIVLWGDNFGISIKEGVSDICLGLFWILVGNSYSRAPENEDLGALSIFYGSKDGKKRGIFSYICIAIGLIQMCFGIVELIS